MKQSASLHGPVRLRTDREPEAFALAFVNTHDPLRPVVDLLADPEHVRAFLSEWCEMDWDLDWGGMARRLQLFRDELRGVLARFISGDLPLRDLARDLDRRLMHWTWIAQSAAEGNSLRLVYAPSPRLRPVQQVEAMATRGIGDLIAGLGPHRLRQCPSRPCEEIFADRSKSGRRRFCGKRCATRYNVAMFRKRKAT
ncbi:MAG: CGNR zinc finger domain-containing protein [Parvibaculaceae bacterium]